MEARTADVNTAYEQTASRRRNYSFSSYLNLVRESVAVEPGNAGAARLASLQCTASRRRTYVDGELDVFGAERYFGGGMDGGDHYKAAAPVEERPRPAMARERPSVQARASVTSTSSTASGNSRSRLLRDDRRRRSQRQGDAKKCLLGMLRCPCSGERSVDVDGGAEQEVASSGEPASKIDWITDLRMQRLGLGIGEDTIAHFPPNSNNLGAAKAAVGRQLMGVETAGDESASSRRSLTLLTPVKANAPGGGSGKDDDGGGSESSSDLFEIRSLMIDDRAYLGGPGAEYEPSEASIAWSVVTASAADVSEAPERDDRTPRGQNGARKRPGRPGGLLTGCASHRAVDATAAARRALAPRDPEHRGADRREEGELNAGHFAGMTGR